MKLLKKFLSSLPSLPKDVLSSHSYKKIVEVILQHTDMKAHAKIELYDGLLKKGNFRGAMFRVAVEQGDLKSAYYFYSLNREKCRKEPHIREVANRIVKNL